MLTKEQKEKIASCKALQGMTVRGLCETQRFRDNLAAYMKAQFDDRDSIEASYRAMKAVGGAKGYKLPSHPIDKVKHFTVGQMAAEYVAVIWGESRLPFAQRNYIRQLGGQAYNLTIAQYVVDEFPEMADVFFVKKSAS